MTSPCVGCGQPTQTTMSVGEPVNGVLARPCCGRCMFLYFDVLPRLLESRRAFGDFLPDPELLKRKPQMVR